MMFRKATSSDERVVVGALCGRGLRQGWLRAFGIAIALGAVSCGGGGLAAPSPGTPAAQSCTATPGLSCFGRNSYVEYLPGELPLVISVPHGGALIPASIPDRTSGTTVTDSNTIELGQAIAAAFAVRSARRPHLILMRLRRTKIDANREVVEAAQGNAEAIQAWSEYHAFTEQAIAVARQRSGTGLFVDLHGHGHTPQRLELGYTVSADVLNGSNAQLDAGGTASLSSLRLIQTPLSFSALLRGPTSLGGLLEPGVPSVPSPTIPSPGEDDYFSGGYSTSRHTASPSGLPGLQIEANFAGVRDSAASRSAFAEQLARAVASFVQVHLGLTI